MRETARVKALRYLTEGRLVVLAVDGDQVRASCRGSGEVYSLGHDRRGGWWCDCPARTDQCAHLIALQSVVVRRAVPRS